MNDEALVDLAGSIKTTNTQDVEANLRNCTLWWRSIFKECKCSTNQGNNKKRNLPTCRLYWLAEAAKAWRAVYSNKNRTCKDLGKLHSKIESLALLMAKRAEI